MGRNGSSGALIMSVSVTVPEKSHENKKVCRRRRRTLFWPFWHRYQMAVTWLYSTLLRRICLLCRGQHADVNI